MREFSALMAVVAWLHVSSIANASETPDARILAFENELRPAVEYYGETPVRWNVLERMEKWNVPALSIAVIRKGKIDWAKAFGVHQSGKTSQITTDTVFSVGSLSKVAAATATLRLVDAGRINLDRHVNEYLNDWKIPGYDSVSARPVTLRGIMSHTAGLSVGGFGNFEPGEPLPTLIQTLNGAGPAKTPPVRVFIEPGTTFSYSGGGTTIEELLVENVSELSFPEASREFVFLPLGMTRSTFENPIPADFGNIAKAHDAAGNPAALPRGWEAMPQRAASGLWTTPTDYAKLIIALMESYWGAEPAFLSTNLARQMMTEVGPGSYGLGPGLDGKGQCRRFSHAGGNDSYRAWMEGNLATGDGMVIFTNSRSSLNLIREVRRAIAASEGFCKTLVDSSRRLGTSESELEKFVGQFITAPENSIFAQRLRGQREDYIIAREGSQLLVNVQGNDIDTSSKNGWAELYQVAAAQFVFDEVTSSSKHIQYLEFVSDYDGTVSSLIVRVGDYAIEAPRKD